MAEKLVIEGVDFNDIKPRLFTLNVMGNDYLIKEASHGAASQYRNAVMACTTFNQDSGAITIKGIANTEAFLISLCMFNITPEGEQGSPVALTEINKWPNRYLKPIFKHIREISDLEEVGTLAKPMEALLAREDSPLDARVFFDWLKAAVKEDKELKPLLALVPENLPKNSQSDTMES